MCACLLQSVHALGAGIAAADLRSRPRSAPLAGPRGVVSLPAAEADGFAGAVAHLARCVVAVSGGGDYRGDVSGCISQLDSLPSVEERGRAPSAADEPLEAVMDSTVKEWFQFLVASTKFVRIQN